MAKIELGKVIDLIIKEDNAGVDSLLENWFRQQQRAIHESIMEDDNIEDDQNEIESEEFFGADDLSEDEDTELDVDSSDDGEDIDVSMSDEDDMGEPSDLQDPASSEIPSDITDFSTDPDVIQDQFADVNADLERLEAEFDEMFGNNEDGVDDLSSDDAVADLDESLTDDDLDAEEDDMIDDLEEDEECGPYDDLAEALKLDLVNIPDLDDEDGFGIGDDHKKIGTVNAKSPALQKGIDARFEGAGPVEIKSPNNVKGYPEFAKLPVKDGNGAKGTIRNKDLGLSDVPAGGDKSALINKPQGKTNDKSILGDGSDSREATIRKIARK